MKKIYLLVFIFTIISFNLKVSAADTNYSTVISEKTTISNDLNSLGVNIDKYHASEPASNQDWFNKEKNRFEFIDFAVVKLDEEYATFYSYIYDPYKFYNTYDEKIQTFWISFEINNYSFEPEGINNNYHIKELDYDMTHGIFKLSGYKFKFSDKNTITVTSIVGEMFLLEYRLTCFPNITKEIVFKKNIIPSEPGTSAPSKVIDSTTSIEDDFLNLNLNIDDYYIPVKYDYSKWYVVAMALVFEDDKIQSYFYLYNPTPNTASAFEIKYKLDNVMYNGYFFKLKTLLDHGLYKVKGFTMPNQVNKTSQIEVSNIIAGDVNSKSDFSLEASISQNGTELTISTKFNSTIIIEEYTVIQIEVHQDDNFINGWNSFWNNGETTVLVYFYNFNLPKDIKYDSIEYAKFQYDYLTYHDVEYWLSNYGENEHNLTNSEKVVSEYNNESKKLRVNDTSQELNFPTFYLGNRIKDKQFGSLNITLPETSFDYDCSVLLDSSYKTIQKISRLLLGNTVNVGEQSDYTMLDQIEMLELHYQKDGVIYKCQIISQSVDKDDVEQGEAVDQSLWSQFVKWFLDNFPLSLAIIFIAFIAALALVVTIIALIIKLIIKILKLPGKIIRKIL